MSEDQQNRIERLEQQLNTLNSHMINLSTFIENQNRTIVEQRNMIDRQDQALRQLYDERKENITTITNLREGISQQEDKNETLLNFCNNILDELNSMKSRIEYNKQDIRSNSEKIENLFYSNIEMRNLQDEQTRILEKGTNIVKGEFEKQKHEKQKNYLKDKLQLK